jgi:hypothetical protein
MTRTGHQQGCAHATRNVKLLPNVVTLELVSEHRF